MIKQMFLMKSIVSLISTAIVLSLFGFGQSLNHNDAPIYLKDSTIRNVLEGTYSFKINTHKDDPEFVGHLFLEEGTYSFEFRRSYIDLSETNIPDFFFLEIKDGKYIIEYNINENTKPSELKDHQIIGTVTFLGNSNEDSDDSFVNKLLLRIDKEKQALYFHSLQSEFQTWSLEKPIMMQGKTKNSSEIPDTLQLLLKIKNVLPIGWGIKYSCDIEEVKKGYLHSDQLAIIISVSVGSEHYLEKIHLLETEAELLFTFINSGRTTDKSYIPAGTTGYLNRKGEIWDIILIEEIN